MGAKKTALITGITGQDGSYLAQLLIDKGYRVFGAVRRASTLDSKRLAALDLVDKVELRALDIQDFASIMRLIEEVAPDEIYNLGGQSSPQASFQQPLYTGQTAGLGILQLMEAVRLVNDDIRIFEAASSEIFGAGSKDAVNETHDCHPRSPYGVAKLFAYWSVVNYREAHGLHVSNGIMFNHESPLRGMDFVTRKITATLAQIACGSQQMLMLGNLDNARDWGFAGDYVDAMWLMLQQEQPEDFVIATGRQESVRRFIELTAQQLGWGPMSWEGEGTAEVGRRGDTGAVVVRIDPRYFRPAEVDTLLGDPSKAREKLGWTPTTTLEELVAEMVATGVEEAKKEAYLKRKGFVVVGARE